MSENDSKLEHFLRRNRPLPGKPREGERERIWRRLPPRGSRHKAPLTVLLLFLAGGLYFGLPRRTPTPDPSAIGAEVRSALELSFLDEGEQGAEFQYLALQPNQR